MTTHLMAALNVAAIAENKQQSSLTAAPFVHCSAVSSDPIVHARSETRRHASIIYCHGPSYTTNA